MFIFAPITNIILLLITLITTVLLKCFLIRQLENLVIHYFFLDGFIAHVVFLVLFMYVCTFFLFLFLHKVGFKSLRWLHFLIIIFLIVHYIIV